MTEMEFVIQFHNKLMEVARLVTYYYNPCKIEGNSCLVDNPNPCCINSIFGKGVCPFMGEGCEYRNLGCSVWFCKTSLEKMDEKCKKIFYGLEELGEIYNLIGRPHLGEGYVGADKQNKTI